VTVALAGQLIGSVRRVWFAPVDHAAERVAATVSGSAAGAIEIETKSGRYVQLAALEEQRGVELRAGAVPAASGRDGSKRVWEDLTTRVPAAFDGRPAIVAVVPVEPGSTAAGNPAAREWRFELSTGAVLTCRRSGRGLEFGQLRR
jgi:hypothetical protein